MAKPEKVVMVCVNRRPPGHPKGSCSDRGGTEVFVRFSEVMDERGLFGKFSLIQTGCLGPCTRGPVVAIMPDNVWYGEVSTEDVDKIVEKHLINGEVLEEKLLKDEEWG